MKGIGEQLVKKSRYKENGKKKRKSDDNDNKGRKIKG